MRWIAWATSMLWAGAVFAQGSPPGCNGASSGATWKLFVNDTPTPQTDCVQQGEEISWQITLETGAPIDVDGDGTYDLISCNNRGGLLVLEYPSGEQVVLEGELDLPEWGHGSEAINITIGGYVANEADADEQGFLTAHLSYCCWTVLQDPPLDSEKLIELTISVCLITQSFCCDTNGDNVVDIQDLLDIIMNWGELDHPADVDGDGLVSITDLKCVILSWGPC